MTPVGTLGVRVAFYSANVQKDRHGRSMGNNFSLDVLFIGVAYFRMTDYRLLGARYGYSVAVPFFQMDASVRVQTPGGPLDLQADPFRMADISVTPLILQWDLSPNLFVNARMQIQAPTGDYDKNRLISPGVNHWTLSPTVNTTYITDSGFEVSSSFQTDINTRNPATDYKSGVEYRHEFAVGQHAGPFTLGWAGSTTGSSPMTMRLRWKRVTAPGSSQPVPRSATSRPACRRRGFTYTRSSARVTVRRVTP
ncbi:hypothetical protein ALP93_00248 [Pseudomonas syringae pv. helianthi]|nr:hypothetical protein ALP93_00248 [Pseudomonas syringae pv. helianthi]